MARTGMLPENQMWQYRVRKLIKRFLLYAVLIGGALVMITPFVWMITSSSRHPMRFPEVY